MTLRLCFHIYRQYILGTHSEIHYFLNERENILFSMVSPYPKWMCFSSSKQVSPPWGSTSWELLLTITGPPVSAQTTSISQLPILLKIPNNSFCWKFLIIHHLPSFQIQQKYTSSVIYNTTLLIWFLLFSITLQPTWQECSGKSLPVIASFLFASTARMSANDKRKSVSFISVSPLKVHVALYLESIQSVMSCR